jgi:hypothetical protein
LVEKLAMNEFSLALRKSGINLFSKLILGEFSSVQLPYCASVCQWRYAVEATSDLQGFELKISNMISTG